MLPDPVGFEMHQPATLSGGSGISRKFMIFSLFTLLCTAEFLFGISVGMQKKILQAVIAERIHISKRGTTYGIFNTVYEAGFFIAADGRIYPITVKTDTCSC